MKETAEKSARSRKIHFLSASRRDSKGSNIFLAGQVKQFCGFAVIGLRDLLGHEQQGHAQGNKGPWGTRQEQLQEQPSPGSSVGMG